MAPTKHAVLAIALCAGALTPGASALAEAKVTPDGRKSSASLDFRIVIPAILRVTENSYPAQLPATNATNGRISALQHLVLLSTMRKGFCMDLTLNQPLVADWQVQASGSTGVSVQASDAGYRVCASRAGRYELALQYAFNLKPDTPGNTTAPIAWPVSMDLAAL
ncbi:MAG: hypothetical protein RIS34_2010 [Pseudomonadota bacterium]|jgi:hypothetical protein